jgi:hypothetical protein
LWFYDCGRDRIRSAQPRSPDRESSSKASKASKESDVDPEIGAAGWVLTVVMVSRGLNEMIRDESRGSRVIRVRVRDGSAWEVVDVVRAYACVRENRTGYGHDRSFVDKVGPGRGGGSGQQFPRYSTCQASHPVRCGQQVPGTLTRGITPRSFEVGWAECV